MSLICDSSFMQYIVLYVHDFYTNKPIDISYAI